MAQCRQCQVRRPINGEGRKLKRQQADVRIVNTVEAFIVDSDLYIAPQPFELRAGSGKFVNKLHALLAGVGTRHVCAERSDSVLRHTLPILLFGSDTRIGKHEAKNVSFSLGNWL